MVDFENFLEPVGADWVRKNGNVDEFCNVVNDFLSQRLNISDTISIVISVDISEIKDAVSADVIADWDYVLNAGICRFEEHGWWQVDVTDNALVFNYVGLTI